MNTQIGKIRSVSFGFGGYQDACLGLSVTLGSDKDSWVVKDFKGFWGPHIEPTKSHQWTNATRREKYGETVEFVGELLVKAKVSSVSGLKGVPVEVVFNGGKLSNWRILEEVL